MQTFVPFMDHGETARALDRQRLGKQRIECVQILNAMFFPSRWSHHPAVKMWDGHHQALAEYGIVICQEWARRGYVDNQMPVLRRYRDLIGIPDLPEWWGGPIHESHRSILIQKNPYHYRPLFPCTPENLPCFWPVT